MLKYYDKYKGAKMHSFSRVENSIDLNIKYILVPVLEYTSAHCGNLYRGSSKWVGVRKTGEFFEIDNEYTLIEEEPQYYA